VAAQRARLPRRQHAPGRAAQRGRRAVRSGQRSSRCVRAGRDARPGFNLEMAAGPRRVGNPIGLDATPASYRRIRPALGAEDAALRAWLRGSDGALGG
jgi:hypothetical protein